MCNLMHIASDNWPDIQDIHIDVKPPMPVMLDRPIFTFLFPENRELMIAC